MWGGDVRARAKVRVRDGLEMLVSAFGWEPRVGLSPGARQCMVVGIGHILREVLGFRV
jgi:hypothetical protein